MWALYWTRRNPNIRLCITTLSVHETTSLKLVIEPDFCIYLQAFSTLYRYLLSSDHPWERLYSGSWDCRLLPSKCPKAFLMVRQSFPDGSWAKIKKIKWNKIFQWPSALRFLLPLFDVVWNIHLDNLILLFFHAQLCSRTIVSGINKIMYVFVFNSCQVIPPCFSGHINNRLCG